MGSICGGGEKFKQELIKWSDIKTFEIEVLGGKRIKSVTINGIVFNDKECDNVEGLSKKSEKLEFNEGEILESINLSVGGKGGENCVNYIEINTDSGRKIEGGSKGIFINEVDGSMIDYIQYSFEPESPNKAMEELHVLIHFFLEKGFHEEGMDDARMSDVF